MANQFTDTRIIECNRLHSEEALSKNNDNYSLWTNNLTDIITLDAGDRISVHGAMISERGAGQSDSIEIKGVNLGFEKTFNFVEVENKNASASINTGYAEISSNASSSIISIRDDTLNFALTYYQTANAHNYIQLPRRFWYKNGEKREDQWKSADSKGAGQTGYNIVIEYDKFCFKEEFHVLDQGNLETPVEGQRFYKHKNDNSRYTLMIRDNTYYAKSNASGNLGGFKDDSATTFPSSLGRSRDPENGVYNIYKELKSIVLPNGFNSPETIANSITRQLQKITEQKIYKDIRGTDGSIVPTSLTNTPLPIYRTIATETYKPFNVANIFRMINRGENEPLDYGVIESAFTEYMIQNASSGNASGFDYLSQYQIIGTLRPELYETGRKINYSYNSFHGENKPSGIFGTSINASWKSTTNLISLNQKYTKESVENLRDFIQAQEKYPEVWDFLKSDDNDYSGNDTIDNSRWIHMNRYSNASMTYNGSSATQIEEAMLGDSYYRFNDWNGSTEAIRKEAVGSLLLPISFDKEQKDIYYDYVENDGSDANNPMVIRGLYSYGCISSNAEGWIVLKTTDSNGAGSPLYTELLRMLGTNLTEVESGRKCGFDLHFTAPAMSYILPYAGYSPVAESYNASSTSAGTKTGDYVFDAIDYTADENYNGEMFVNKLYFGSDTPKLNWDGTNFSFSELHTPLNKGNFNNAGSVFSNSEPARDPDEAHIVYKINPVEQKNDWTPERKPYSNPETVVNASQTFYIDRLNKNLLPWEIYDSHTGIFIQDFNLTEIEWTNTLWDLLGFTYEQFNSPVNNRLIKTTNRNKNNLQILTTNAEINQGETKIYTQNGWGVPLYNNMMPMPVQYIMSNLAPPNRYPYYPPIAEQTQSNKIVAQRLPTRMIRGYYTIRSNIIEDAPFIGGKKNNTIMPIVSIVDKIHGDGDFYFQQESSLNFVVTKPLRLASLTCSIHDPDGSYAKTSEQNTILFKIQRDVNRTFISAQEFIDEQQQKK
tara:strand:- start:1035 stop:4028 length:2994 start_codon:yes stop_codon:yes gene_type:complete